MENCKKCGNYTSLKNGICSNCIEKIKCWFCEASNIKDDDIQENTIIIKKNGYLQFESTFNLCSKCSDTFRDKIKIMTKRYNGE